MSQKIKEQIRSVKHELKEIESEGGWYVIALQNELERLRQKDDRNEKKGKRNDS